MRRTIPCYTLYMNAPTPFVGQLATKYHAPVDVVERLIHEETAIISAQARVTTFVPIFVTRRVEERLRTRSFVEPPATQSPAVILL